MVLPPGAPPLPPVGRGVPAGQQPPRGASITSGNTGAFLDHIRTAILALQMYAEMTHDDQELATVHACITQLQKLLAGHAKNRDAALGITPAVKHVRRVAAQGGY